MHFHWLTCCGMHLIFPGDLRHRQTRPRASRYRQYEAVDVSVVSLIWLSVAFFPPTQGSRPIMQKTPYLTSGPNFRDANKRTEVQEMEMALDDGIGIGDDWGHISAEIVGGKRIAQKCA